MISRVATEKRRIGIRFEAYGTFNTERRSMKVLELIEKLEEIAQRNPEAEVRIEAYDSNSKRASTLNGISRVIEHVTSEKITILGDGKIREYF